jgi:uncharacterized membrane protein (UPF0182 family)
VAMRPPMPSMILSRRAKIALGVVVGLIVLLIVLVKLSGVYINYLWFGEVGHRNVYSTMLWTKVSLFFIFGVLMALIIGGNLVIAYLIKPPFRPMSPEQANLQNYVLLVEPRRRLVLIVVSLIALLAAGASAQGKWMQWQLWLHRTSFGATDPQFHRDIGWYAWDYPIYRILLGFGFSAIIFTLILTVGVHYLTGAIRLQTPGPRVTIAARRQITLLVFFFIAFKAIAYWLDRYALVFSNRSKFTGASYTDVHSELPAKTILFWIAVILALAVLASVWLRSSLIPGIGFITLIVLSILIGGIYPAIVQQVSVKPNASTKEAPYIKRNIHATRTAYGIVTKTKKTPSGTVSYTPYDVNPNPSETSLKSTDPTVANLRILDPNVLSPTFAQQQAQQKNFYGFPTKLDVDRYTDSAKATQDYVVGVRELSAARLSGQQTNWINEHTNYTHGYGFVAAAANTNVTTGGALYADGGIPQSGTLNSIAHLKQPEVYYGELVPDYAIVGAEGTPREFNGDGSAKTTYAGSGGISLSSPLTKLAFAVNYKETNFLLNDAVSASGAKILINRDPRKRVEKIAPFLKTDGDPYPVVDPSSGDIVWIVDAYTTMDNYPYSERQSLSSLTSDSLTQSNRTAGQPNDQINYIRNSVKATVDAYTGKVTLYDWDSSDPVLNTWKKVFPGLVQPEGNMPPDIKAHIRYPEDLFNVQRNLLQQYHVSNPVTFYNVGDKWTVPSDPAPGAVGAQPPYYVLADPQNGGSGAQFQLTSPMKVNSKTNLAAYISVDSDPGPKYGQMSVLTVPAGKIVQGPEQIANTLDTTDVISSYITLQGRNGSTVVHGNLLTLPIGNSFLYVEPLYVQAQTNGYPILRRVLVDYGGDIGFAADLQDALSDLLPGHTTGQTIDNASDDGNNSTPTTPPSTPTNSSSPSAPSSGSSNTPSTSPPKNPTVNSLLTQVNDAQTALKNAYASGNATTIARAEARVQILTNKLVAALNKSVSASPAASPSPTPTKTKSGSN